MFGLELLRADSRLAPARRAGAGVQGIRGVTVTAANWSESTTADRRGPEQTGRTRSAATRKPLASEVIRRSLAENTRVAYRAGWKRFVAYCRGTGTEPLEATPTDVADFLIRLASAPRSPRATTKRGEPLALGTIRICLAAINRQFSERDRDSPARHPSVATVLQALGRLSNGRRRQVKALWHHEIVKILRRCDERAGRKEQRLIAARDAALLAVGFAAALRRSEICGLRFEDIEFLGGAKPRNGMFLDIRRSKTDPYGRGERIAIPDGAVIRPVKRIQDWLTLSRIERGPVFQAMRRGGHLQGRPLGPSDVARLVKQYAGAIGLDPAEYSGHSLRAGFVTSAAAHHARLDKIMEVTRHKSTDMVLRYIRQADAFEDHAGAGFL